MLAREVEINVPRALALPPADAVDECGDPERRVAAGVVVPIQGDIDGMVLLLIPYEQAEILCSLLGVEAHTEVGDSALREIGNILAASYLNGLGSMTGLELEPSPPHLHSDMLAAVVSSLLVGTASTDDLALVLDCELDVSGDPCSISFLLPDLRADFRSAGAARSCRPFGLTMASARMGEMVVSNDPNEELVAAWARLLHRAGDRRPHGRRRWTGAYRPARRSDDPGRSAGQVRGHRRSGAGREDAQGGRLPTAVSRPRSPAARGCSR